MVINEEKAVKASELCNSGENRRGISERKHAMHFQRVNRVRLTANTKAHTKTKEHRRGGSWRGGAGEQTSEAQDSGRTAGVRLRSRFTEDLHRSMCHTLDTTRPTFPSHQELHSL